MERQNHHISHESQHRPRYRALLVGLVAVFLAFGPALSANQKLRIMAANTTSGNFQAYGPAGIRIFQGLQADVILIQEFNYRDGSLRDLVDEAFGENFAYYVEGGGEQIPNGIVSRYPIVESGEWNDAEVSNRDFAWARIDIPGERDLWAVSVHFLTRGSGVRNTQARALVDFIEGQVPPDVYLVIGGDFNTDNFGESALGTLSSVVDVSGRPDDQNGSTGTNASRAKPYDQILPGPDLVDLEIPVSIPGHSVSYPEGLVFDSRVFTPLSAVSPIQGGDSGVSGMQHMAVIRDFLLPTGGPNPGPIAYPSDFAGLASDQSITLTWTDVVLSPLPDGYLILASDGAPLEAPADGPLTVSDSDLSDGTARVFVAPNSGEWEFSGLTPNTEYFFKIFPYVLVEGSALYKTDSIAPTLSRSTLLPAGSTPEPPELGPTVYPHATGATLTWELTPNAEGYRVDLSKSESFSGGEAPQIDENFDADTAAPTVWTNNGTGFSNLSTHLQSAPYARSLGANSSLVSPPVDFPVELTFHVDSSGSGNGKTASVSYASGEGAWQTLHTFEVSQDGKQEVVDLTGIPDLSGTADIRFRFESDFFTWYLDDVVVKGFSALEFVAGYEDSDVGQQGFYAVEGLEPDTDYFFRIRAQNAFFTSPNSATGSFRTTPSGSPFSVWGASKGIGTPTLTSDFDGDGLSDFAEYAFSTPPDSGSTQADFLQVDPTADGLQVSVRRSRAPNLNWQFYGAATLGALDTPLDPALGNYEILSRENFGSYERLTLRIDTSGHAQFFFKVEVTEEVSE